MSRLVESVKILDGAVVNPSYHSRRMNESRRDLFSLEDSLDILDIVSVPGACSKGIFKCRVIYADRVFAVAFEPYTRREIGSLKLVYDDCVDYSHKYEDRERILSLFGQREDCDDILVVKKGLITDTSFSNIAFFDGHSWITPASPLLKGTQRACLLDRGLIREEELAVGDIPRFSRAALINAMLELGDTVLPVRNIV